MTTLAELRQANLQEQKKQDGQNGHAPEAQPLEQQLQERLAEVRADEPPVAEVREPEQPVRRREMRAAARPDSSHRRIKPGGPTSKPVKESDKEALVDILPAISKAVVSLATQVAVQEGEPEKSAAFLNRVRGSLNHKILYPCGVKTTVDMSPALFHRAKKYCLDHGNVTLRQLFLDLLTEYLAEEGY